MGVDLRVVSDVSPFLLALAVAVIATVVWWSGSRREPPGAFEDMTSPPWSDAIAKARGSVPTLRELFPAHRGRIAVKFPLQTSRGELEHVWGELLELGQDSFVAGLDTPPRRGKPVGRPPYTLALSELEDWQLEMPDGAIRGGYTTRLDLERARERGQAIPDHILAMESRFVDP
ncbi:MAG: hypothetical protein R3E98_17180 [Gemmatimonadota bacterium]|nr:hypothetical protein [Gemmatimonadota bacterium]